MSHTDDSFTQPKSIRQKRILTIAKDNPDATLAEIAAEIPSVSTDHVERVFTQYGDPAAPEDTDAAADGDGGVGTSNSTTGTDTDNTPTDNTPADANTNDSPTDNTPPDTDAGDPTPDEPIQTDTTATDNPQTAQNTRGDDHSSDDPPRDASAPHMTETDTHAQNGTAPDDTDSDTASSNGSSPSTDAQPASEDAHTDNQSSSTLPDPDDLTQKENETLKAIHYEPTATQQQVAEMLDVSRATVSNRVNAIEGFDWADRQSFVTSVLDNPTGGMANSAGTTGTTDPTNTTDTPDTETTPEPDSEPVTSSPGPEPTASASTNGSTPTNGSQDTLVTDGADALRRPDVESMATTLETMNERLSELESTIDEVQTAQASLSDDHEILHKVVHACMDSERFSEAEELAVLKTLLR